MAECQESFDYDADLVESLGLGLSQARFQRYVAECHGDSERAVHLYLWNARLAKAFLFPLQICEVVSRNTIHSAFSTRWGADWVVEPPFALNDFSRDSHTRTVSRVHRNAEANGLVCPTVDDIVAALTFDFWSNLFRQDYDQILWRDGTLLSAMFPELPEGHSRREVQRLMASVNQLRNRIAHHEPIYNRQDHGAKLGEILTLIGYVSRPIREWTRQHSTVMLTSKTPPNAHSTIPGRPLAQSNLRRPPIFEPTAKLIDALRVIASSKPAVALVSDPSSECGFCAVTALTIAAYAAARLDAADGLFDFGEHTLRDVIAENSVSVGTIDYRSTTGDAMSRFYPKKGQIRVDLLAVQSNGEIIGLLQRPDTRF